MSEQILYGEYSNYGYTVTTHRFITPNRTFDIAQIPICYMRYSDERHIAGKVLRWTLNGFLLLIALAGGIANMVDGNIVGGVIALIVAAAGYTLTRRFVKWGEYRVYHLYLDEAETVAYQPVPSTTYSYGPYPGQTTNWNMVPITRGGNSVLSSRNLDLVGNCHDAINHAVGLQRGYTLNL